MQEPTSLTLSALLLLSFQDEFGRAAFRDVMEMLHYTSDRISGMLSAMPNLGRVTSRIHRFLHAVTEAVARLERPDVVHARSRRSSSASEGSGATSGSGVVEVGSTPISFDDLLDCLDHAIPPTYRPAENEDTGSIAASAFGLVQGQEAAEVGPLGGEEF